MILDIYFKQVVKLTVSRRPAGGGVGIHREPGDDAAGPDQKYDHVFIIAFKQTDNRMTFFLRSIIPLPEKMFRKQFWNNTIPEAIPARRQSESICR